MQGLIDGSKAINQMKQEVKMIVRMVRSLALACSFEKRKLSVIYDNCEWEIDDQGNGQLTFKCRVYLGDSLMLAYSSKNNYFQLETVPAVYEALPYLVSLVRSHLPSIEK